MAKKICAVCLKELGMFSGKFRAGSRIVCPECFRKAGFTSEEMAGLRRFKGDLFEEVKRRIRINEKNLSEARELIGRYGLSEGFLFDDEGRRMMFSEYPRTDCRPEDYKVFAYDQLMSYEAAEDDISIARGEIGRPSIGGIPADIPGESLAGICHSFIIKISFNHYKEGIFTVRIIDEPTDKTGSEYKEAMEKAGRMVSKLRALIDEKNREALQAAASVPDAADEIRKFKALLDDAIITEEEFNAKKKQLLGI